MVEWLSTKERINERGSYHLVEWSCTKERINERGPYIIVEWSCTNKRNKSVWTLLFGLIVVHKRKNKWRRTIYFLSNGRVQIKERVLVHWSCAKERLNERGRYNSVEWSCAHRRNKPMRTLIFGRIVVHKWAFFVWAH